MAGPAASSSSDIQTQANIIQQKINFADLHDPAKLDKFISRFSALYDLTNQNAQQDPVVSLFSGTTDGSGIGDSLLASIQNFKPPR